MRVVDIIKLHKDILVLSKDTYEDTINNLTDIENSEGLLKRNVVTKRCVRC